jgi:iron complex transport system permease protein
LEGRWLAVGIASTIGAVLLGCVLGPAGLPLRGIMSEIVSILPGVDIGPGLSARDAAILWQIRMPRVVLGAMVGDMLAMAGAAYQGVFRNPLADPYLLGVAAGAGLGATLAIAYGPDSSRWTIDALPIFAFVGACVGVSLAWLVGRTSGPARDVASLVLAGVAVAAFLTAAQTYVQQRPDPLRRGGNLAQADSRRVMDGRRDRGRDRDDRRLPQALRAVRPPGEGVLTRIEWISGVSRLVGMM